METPKTLLEAVRYFTDLDEQVFRFNKRKLTDSERFQTVIQGVIGKRLTFRQLCMIDGCGFMGIE